MIRNTSSGLAASKGLLTDLQIILDHEDPSNGVMETSWVSGVQ